jgi:hypothetical protein
MPAVMMDNALADHLSQRWSAHRGEALWPGEFAEGELNACSFRSRYDVAATSMAQ